MRVRRTHTHWKNNNEIDILMLELHDTLISFKCTIFSAINRASEHTKNETNAMTRFSAFEVRSNQYKVRDASA